MSEICISEWGSVQVWFCQMGFCSVGFCQLGFCPSEDLSRIPYISLHQEIPKIYFGCTIQQRIDISRNEMTFSTAI